MEVLELLIPYRTHLGLAIFAVIQVVALLVLVLYQLSVWIAARDTLRMRRNVLDRISRPGASLPDPSKASQFPWLAMAARILSHGSGSGTNTRQDLADELDRELTLTQPARRLRALDDSLPKLILIATGLHIAYGVIAYGLHLTQGNALTAHLAQLLIAYLGLNLLNLLNGWFVNNLAGQEQECRQQAMAWFDRNWEDQGGPAAGAGVGGHLAGLLQDLVAEMEQHRQQIAQLVNAQTAVAQQQTTAAQQQADASTALTQQVATLAQGLAAVAASNQAVQQAVAQQRAALQPLAAIPGQLQALQQSNQNLAQVSQDVLTNNQTLFQETQLIQGQFNQTLGQVTGMIQDFATIALRHQESLDQINEAQTTFQNLGQTFADAAQNLGTQTEAATTQIGQAQLTMATALGRLQQGSAAVEAALTRIGATLDQRLTGLAQGATQFAEAVNNFAPAVQEQVQASGIFRQAADALEGSVAGFGTSSTEMTATAHQFQTGIQNLVQAVGSLTGALQAANQTTGQLSTVTTRYEAAANALGSGTQTLEQEVAAWRGHSASITQKVEALTASIQAHLDRLDRTSAQPLAAVIRDFHVAVKALNDAARAHSTPSRRPAQRTWAGWMFGRS